jgi:hypothetical protein
MHRSVRGRLSALLTEANKNGWTWIERASWVWIVLGVPLLFIEHHLQVERDKSTATLEFVKRYQDAQLASERFVLLAPWMKIDVEAFRRAKPSPRAIQDLVLKLVDSSASSAGQRDMREAIFSIVDFYETLQLCIDADMCDKKLAASYFGEYSTQFYCLYKPYIQKLRKQQNMPSYGRRLEQLASTIGCDKE